MATNETTPKASEAVLGRSLDMHRKLLRLHHEFDMLKEVTPDGVRDEVLEEKTAAGFRTVILLMLELVQHYNSPIVVAEIDSEELSPPPPPPPVSPSRGIRPELN